MMNTANKQARSVVIGHHVQVAPGEFVAVTGTRHVYSYNNPSGRRQVAEVTLDLADNRVVRATGNERIPVGW